MHWNLSVPRLEFSSVLVTCFHASPGQQHPGIAPVFHKGRFTRLISVLRNEIKMKDIFMSPEIYIQHDKQGSFCACAQPVRRRYTVHKIIFTTWLNIWKILFVHSHYNDVIMGAMDSQITSLMIVYRLFRHRLKKSPKLRVTGLCEGNSPVTGEFPTQRASYAENVSDWWRHNDSPHLWTKHYHYT